MMAKRNGIPKTDPSEIEALIRRLKQSNIGALAVPRYKVRWLD
jgi:hypothetical protein